MLVGNGVGVGFWKPPAAAGGVAPIDPATVAGRQLICVYQTGITDVGGGRCSQWADASGNARHPVQGTAAERPNILAGPPQRLDFDGVDFELDGPTATSTIITAAAYTGFLVFEDDAINTNSGSTFLNDALIVDGGGLWGLHLKSTGPTAMAYNWDGADKHADIVFPSGGKKLITWWRDSAASTLNIQLNGGTPVTTAAVGAIVGSLAPIFGIGGKTTTTTIQFDGRIDDIAIFNVTLSDANRNGINAFYKQLHGL